MGRSSRAFLIIAFLILPSVYAAAPFQTIDLESYAGESGFNSIGANLLLPRGSQAIQGVPFQFAGVIELFGGGSAQAGHPRRVTVDNIPVGRTFEVLHLISGTAWSATNGAAVALIQLTFADGTSTNLSVVYGVHTMNYYNYRHQKEPYLLDSLARVAWTGQGADPARWDKELRLFHAALTNPLPRLEVKNLSLISTKTQAGLIVAAITVGDRNAELLTDTLPDPQMLDDSGERHGELVPIRGRVLSEDGKPLSNVRVRVSETRNFNTYEDDTTQDIDDSIVAATDGEGRFNLRSVPDNCLYHLLATIEGFQPAIFPGVDPRRGLVEMRLKPEVKAVPKLNFYIWGKLVGPDAKPVVAALVEPDGIEEEQGKSWGGNHGFASRLFSDAAGEFVMERKKAFTQLCLNIRAPGLAPLKIWLGSTNTLQTIPLTTGARIVGRALKDGKPLGNVQIGVCGQDRSSEVFAGHFITTADSEGRFAFQHLPPNTAWYIYGIMNSMKAYGALPPRPVHSENAGETLDLGDIAVGPGVSLSGRVQSRNGERLPASLKIILGSETAWDSQAISVDEDGAFNFGGIAKGLTALSLSVDGWRLSSSNSSIDDSNPFRLIGLLEADKKDLLLVIERGKRDFNNYWDGNGPLPSQDESRNRPLFGAEPGGPVNYTFTGTVVDDRTGAPIELFTVVPGRKPLLTVPRATSPKPLVQQLTEPFKRKVIPFNERPYWDRLRSEQFTNGKFSISFAPFSGLPLFRIEAPHHLSFETGTLPAGTNLIIHLKSGAGPAGIVQLPSGQTAKGATVLFLGDNEQCGLNGSGDLMNYGEKKNLQTTGADGRFNFDARSNGRTVYISNAQGWARMDVSEFSGERTVRLKPWAVITGTLVDTNGVPVPNIPISATPYGGYRAGDPYINFQPSTTTDKSGRFQLGTIPPDETLTLIRRIISPGGNGWSEAPQTWFVAEAGKTNDLGKVTFDRPPPKPILDRLKEKLGI